MARPKKIEKEKKKLRTSVCMTEDEKKLLVQKAQSAGLELSPYLVACGLTKVIKAPITYFDRQGIAQLARVGNNINQITKAVNMANLDRRLFDEAIQQIEELQELLYEITRGK
ncbi:MAG: MobC family plasmid mobilization relaxosome protein [Sediminibacterium sp. Gen4]|jgi:hypothetical protein|uniref:MobC family plasmid mobilization relaxosome protein n=1 Tax=Sediminibacterium sp. Gen4 TaxID=2736285 RepID=UPI0015B86D81|nr:MobC family plasmid mobilization relaxosome protein [Sediminibacterium sp. Gen4]NWK66486.1 MobC family plasmid mobilization relaxosome protein [Sediminibacterium sp. Gen4]